MNVTIDDTGGDSLTGAKPLYTASGNAYTWRGRPSQDPCPLCAANLDTTQTHLGTWHDGTCDGGGISTVSFSFSGSAVYIYAVLPNAVPGNSATHLAFHIDGSLVGTFTRQPNTSSSAPAYVYNQLVYSNVSLGRGGDSGVERNFLIVNGGGSDASLFLFDYAMYTMRSVGSTSGSTTASEISALPSTERSPVASASSSILSMDITSSTSTSNRAQSSSVLSVSATTTKIPTPSDAPDTPLAEASESSDRTGDHSSRTTSIVIATTTTTVTIIVIVLVLCIVRRRRRRRRSRMAAKVAALEKRMAQVQEAVGVLGLYGEGGNRDAGQSPNGSVNVSR